VYRNLRAVIERLDSRRAQVFIESLIVEVRAERAAEFGVQWQFLNGLTAEGTRAFGGTNLGRNQGGNILDLMTNPLANTGQGLNIGVVKGTITVAGTEILNLGLLARALETRANANILATPNLLTLDNEEARIIIGQNVPILSGQFTSTGTGGSTVNPFQTFERRDVGTSLRVKPQISESGTVKLQIFQEVSSVFSQSAQGVITNRRAIESNVLVDDGQIVVLGGLIEESTEGGQDKVPGLGDLPVIGQLFRYDSRKRVKTNLLVFLRPVVIRDANAAHGVSTDRYDYIRQQQGDSRLPPHFALPDFPATDLAPMPAAPARESTSPRPTGGPASLSPDVDRSARGLPHQMTGLESSAPAPITPSVPTTIRAWAGDQPSN
jgi:general secretion pathway protein D